MPAWPSLRTDPKTPSILVVDTLTCSVFIRIPPVFMAWIQEVQQGVWPRGSPAMRERVSALGGRPGWLDAMQQVGFYFVPLLPPHDRGIANAFIPRWWILQARQHRESREGG